MGASHPWCKNQPTGEWWVTLCYTACQEGHRDGVRFLVECGNVNQADDGGRTPLFIACHKGHIDVISTLLEGGANVKHRDENGATAFCLSCQAAHFAISKLSLRNVGRGSTDAAATWRECEPIRRRCDNSSIHLWMFVIITLLSYSCSWRVMEQIDVNFASTQG